MLPIFFIYFIFYFDGFARFAVGLRRTATRMLNLRFLKTN
jgi:hypothetical protein